MTRSFTTAELSRLNRALADRLETKRPTATDVIRYARRNDLAPSAVVRDAELAAGLA